MAHLYRPTVVKPVPKNAVLRTIDGAPCACWTNRRGKKVQAELTADGKKCRVPSPTWWIEYTAAGGARERVKGYPSREATAHLATDLERRAIEIVSGRAAPSREGPIQLLELVPDFQTSLETKGSSVGHVKEVVRNVRTVLANLSITTPASVNCEAVLRWLVHERRRLKWTLRNQNRYLIHLRQFGRWTLRTGRLNANPFEQLVPTKYQGENSRQRRRLTEDELARLLAAARASDRTVEGLAGPDRARLYLLAAYTGLRLGTLGSLTPECFDWLKGIPATVTVRGHATKNRRDHVVPLHATVGRQLAEWLASIPAGQTLFRKSKWKRRGADLVTHDLALAREQWIAESRNKRERAQREASDTLCKRNRANEVFDFHALRVQFISSLAIAGVPLTAAQQLAAHSTPALTANIYTRWGPSEMAAQVAKLPPAPRT